MKTAPFSAPSPQRRRWLAASLLAVALAPLTACGRKTPRAKAVPAGATVLAVGDSLTSGVGASSDTAYPAVLQQLTGWKVVNGGVSGDTSAQALARLPGLLQQHQPALVIVSIGGNDFLRRQTASDTRTRVRQICEQARAGGAQVLLVAVPQFSLLAAGTGRLSDHPLYTALAKELQLPLLEGAWAEVLSNPALRSDQVHGNAAGYALFTQQLFDFVRQQGWHG